MRTRKEMKIYGKQHYEELAERKPDQKATERFIRPAYQVGSLIKEQGRQLKHKSVEEYLVERYDISGGDKGAKN